MTTHAHIVKKISSELGYALEATSESSTNVTSDYTVKISDSFISVDASSNDITVTMLTAVGISGYQYTIKRADTSATYRVSVAAASGESIDSSADYGIGQDEAVTIVSNGATWEKKSSDAIHSSRRYALMMFGT